MVRKLTNQELMDSYGLGLPAERWFGNEWSSIRNEPRWEGTREGARFAYPPLREGYDPKHLSSYDWFNKEYVKEYPVWQPGAFANISPPSRPTSNEILPQNRFSNLPPLGPRDPGVYEPLNINNYVRYGEAVDRPGGHRDTFDFSAGPPPPEAPQRLQQEVSGEQAAGVPIDPADLVGGSFFSGGDPSRGPAIPGSGFLSKHNVLKPTGTFGALSQLRHLAEANASPAEYITPVGRLAASAYLPGAGALGLFGDLLNSMGAYHQFNPATDSNLFADPETGLSTWGSTSPGGGGAQRGTLNLYNMLQDYGGSYPTRQVQTPSRTIWGSISPGPEKGLPIYYDDDSSSVVPQYANARDLAYIMGRGDRPPPGLYSQQTPVGYQDFGDSNVTNQEALRDYAATGAGAILNEAGAILGPDAGYNETRDLAESIADDLSSGQTSSYMDWSDIGYL